MENFPDNDSTFHMSHIQSNHASRRQSVRVKSEVDLTEKPKIPVNREPLRIGDLIYLTNTFQFDEQQHTVNLIGEGLSDCCNVVEFSKFKPTVFNRYCLFRVEPSFNYKNEKFTPDEEMTKEKLQEDKELDKIVQNACQGKLVLYGDLIQLRHIHSGGHLQLGQRPGVIPGSWDIIIDTEESERSRIWLLPEDSCLRVGDKVKYSDNVVICLREHQMVNHICAMMETKKYDPQVPIGDQSGAYAHHQVQSWKISMYDDYVVRTEFLRFGEPVSLVNKRTGAYLTVKRNGEYDSEDYKVLLSSDEHDFSKYWIFQTIKCLKGGEVEWDQAVVIQNAAVRQYLTADFKLSKEAKDQFYMKRNSTAKDAEKGVANSDEVVFAFDNMLISAQKMHEKSSILGQLVPVSTREHNKSQLNNELVLIEKSKKSKNSIFQVETIPEESGEVTLQMSHVIPLLQSYSRDLNELKGSPVKQESARKLRERRYRTNKIMHALLMLRNLLTDRNIPPEEQIHRQCLFIGLDIHHYLIDVCDKLVEQYFAYITQSFTTSVFRAAKKATVQYTPSQDLSGETMPGQQFSPKTPSADDPKGGLFDFQTATADVKNISQKANTIISSDTPVKAAKKLLRLAVSVLNLVELDNEYACRELSKHIKALVRLIPCSIQHKLGVENLVVQIFKVLETKVEGEQELFNEWCQKLDTVSEANIQYQTLLLCLIATLCESHRSGRSYYQNALIQNIFKSESTKFDIIRLEMVAGKPCVQFLPKDRTMQLAAFSVNNGCIQEQANFIDGIIDLKNMIYYLDKLDHTQYVEYVYQALMLIDQLCQSKDSNVLDFVKNELNFSSKILQQIATDDNLLLCYRDACLRLFTTIYVCGDSNRQSFMKYRSNDFAFHPEDIRDPALQYESIYNEFASGYSDESYQMMRWTLNFWDIENKQFLNKTVDIKQKIDFLCSILYTATSFVDYQYATYLYMRLMTQTWLYILSGVMTQTYSDNCHWCITALRRARKKANDDAQLSLKINELLSYTSQFLSLSLRFQLQERIESLLYVFMQNRSLLDNKQQYESMTEKQRKGIRKQISKVLSKEMYHTALSEELNTNIQFQHQSSFAVHPMDTQPLTSDRGHMYSQIVEETKTPRFHSMDKQDIVEKDIQIENFMLDFIFSKNTTSKRTNRELVQMAMITFDFPGHVKKTIKSVDILMSANLKMYYFNTLSLCKRFHPADILSNFASGCEPDAKKFNELLHTVKQILQNLQLRGTKDQTNFQKQQNVCRHVGIHLKLMKCFNIYKDFAYAGKLHDEQTNGIELFAYIVTTLYNFCYFNNSKNQSNSLNSKEVHGLFTNNAFEPSIYRSADLVNQVSQFKHIRKKNIPQVMKAIISGYCFKAEQLVDHKNSMRYLLKMLFDENDKPRVEMQNLASRIILDKMESKGAVEEEHPETFAELLNLLAYCSFGNESVTSQCQFFYPLTRLQSILDKTTRFDVMKSVINFVTYTYFRTGQDLDPDCVDRMLDWMKVQIQKANSNLDDLVHMASQGYYEQVFPADDPSIVDIIKSTRQEYNKDQQFWLMMSAGDSWERKTGIFKCINILLKHFNQSQKYTEPLDRIQTELDGLIYAIRGCKNNYSTLNFDCLIQAVEKCIVKMKKFSERNSKVASMPGLFDRVVANLHRTCTVTSEELKTGRKSDRRQTKAMGGMAKFMGGLSKHKTIIENSPSEKGSPKEQNQDAVVTKALGNFRNTCFQDAFEGGSFLDKFKHSKAKSTLYKFTKGGKAGQLLFAKSCETFQSFPERTILYKLLKKSIYTTGDEANDLKMQKITRAYFECGIFDMAITSLICRLDRNEGLAAIKLLNKLIDTAITVETKSIANSNPSKDFQINVKKWLSDTNKYYELFLFLKEEIEESKDRILEKYQKDERTKGSGLGAVFEFLIPKNMAQYRAIYTSNKEKSIHLKCVSFLQLLCDNCCAEFQNFMRSQNAVKAIEEDMAVEESHRPLETCGPSGCPPEPQKKEVAKPGIRTRNEERSNIDLVTSLQRYIVDMSQTYGYILIDKETSDAIMMTIKTLVDFVTGPCTANQTMLGTNPKLLKYFSSLIEMMGRQIFDQNGKSDKKQFIKIQEQAVLFLMTLMEGDPESSVFECMKQFLNIKAMTQYVVNVYNTLIVGRENIVNGNIQKKNPNGLGILDLANARDRDYITPVEARIIDVSTQITILLMKIKKSKKLRKEPAYIKFYQINIGYVEILKTDDDRIEAHYFKIPNRVHLLSSKSVQFHLENNGEESHQKKLEEFVKKSDLADREMNHQERIYKYSLVYLLSKSWQHIGMVQFLLIVAINLYMILTDPSPEALEGQDDPDYEIYHLPLYIAGFAQLIWMVFSYAFYCLEHYPIIIYSHLFIQDEEEYSSYFTKKHNSSLKMSTEYKEFRPQQKTSEFSVWEKGWFLVTTQESIYHMSYLVISAFAIYYPYLYGICLVDVFKRSPQLVNIIKSITTNKVQLLYTTLLVIVTVYVFSIFAYVNFSEYYINSNEQAAANPGRKSDYYTECGNILDCFVSTFNVGLRLGGGIGEGIGKVDPSEEKYYPRLAFDFAFFVIVIIVLLNIFFGIIIDTFAQLRDERRDRWLALNTKCFICGLDRSAIELHSKGWTHHFMESHSPMAYLAFIIYVKDKESTECSGLEKYVKERIESKNIDFFPNTSIELQKNGILRQDE